MQVTLTPHLKKFVEQRVKAGGYADASEVVREALRLLEKIEACEPADLEELIIEADEEPASPMTQDDWDEIRSKVFGKQRKAAA
jgi:antitoxin ParD1/3/4